MKRYDIKISNSLKNESYIQPNDHLCLIQNTVLILIAKVEMALDLLHF